MARKADCGFDNVEESDMYDNCNCYDDNYDIEGEDKSSKLEKAVSKPDHWRCSICMYDNYESMLSCDICGVFRELSITSGNEGKKEVDRTCNDSGPSIMAKSLFARRPSQVSKTTIIGDDLLSKGANIFYEQGNTKTSFDGLQRIFMASDHNNPINIAPFSFDTLSPDDVVSLGKNSSATGSKGKRIIFLCLGNG